jgi:hypothetical protein
MKNDKILDLNLQYKINKIKYKELLKQLNYMEQKNGKL